MSIVNISGKEIFFDGEKVGDLCIEEGTTLYHKVAEWIDNSKPNFNEDEESDQ